MEKILIGINEVCDKLKLKRSTLYDHLRKQGIVVVKKGNRSFLPSEAIARLQENLKISQPHKVKEVVLAAQPAAVADAAISALTEQLRVKDYQIGELLNLQKHDRLMLAGYQQKFGALSSGEADASAKSHGVSFGKLTLAFILSISVSSGLIWLVVAKLQLLKNFL